MQFTRILAIALVLALPTIALGTPPLSSQENAQAIVQELIERARKQKLAQSRQWLRLGHWRKGVWSGYKSEVDGQTFFASARGKTDPSDELETTIRGFVLGPKAISAVHHSVKRGKDASEHPICRFPARFIWLNNKLNLFQFPLEMPRCPGFERFWNKLSPQAVTVVFSSYYMNNPASAFGHTLLRISRADTLAVGKKRELLDYGVNYSAEVDTQNAVAYGIKGLFGLFRGTFKLMPYYYKVREYNDYESRDLWSYELNLSPFSVKMLAAHLWELGSSYFDYFYLSENCSYQLLALLEAADPQLELLAHVGWPVVPAETVKALYANPNLVKSVHLRPALREQFRNRIAGLSTDERRMVARLSHQPSATFEKDLTTNRRIQILDAALDLVDIQHAKTLVHKTDPAAAHLKHQLLQRRAAIRVPSKAQVNREPTADRWPHSGHGIHRIRLGGGTANRGGAFQSLGFRVALHDLVDPEPGYPTLSQIEFFALNLRFRHGSGDLLLHDAALFRVISLSALDQFNPKFSWHIEIGAKTVEDTGCDECIGPQIRGGFGGAVATQDRTLVAFAFADLLMLYAPGLDGIGGIPLRSGIGPSGGLRIRWRPTFVTVAQARWIWLFAQHPHTSWEAQMSTRWGWSKHNAIGLQTRLGPAGAEAELSLMTYF